MGRELVETIIVRVKKGTKKKLAKIAKHDRRTLSDYLRIEIEDKIDYMQHQHPEIF